MIALLLALSLSNTLLKVGALAAFAALAGIAVLSLLVFSQARELKRLREWAGRAPERAAELEQRVSAEAAARVQRVVPPRAGGVTVAGAPIPRATPVVARAAAPVTGQSPAVGVAGAVPQAAPTGQSAVADPSGLPGAPAGVPGVTAVAQPSSGQASPGPTPPSQPASQPPSPVPGQPAFVPTGQTAPASAAQRVADATAPAAEDKQVAKSGSTGEVRPEVGLAPAAAAVAAASARRVAPGASALTENEQPQAAPRVSAPTPTPTPATAAARASAPGGRSPAPPAPAPGRSAAPARAARPAAPPRPGTSQGERGVPEQPRSGVGQRPAAGARGGRVQGPPFLQEERSAGRTTALIVGGVVFGVAVLVGVLLSLGGGGSSPSKTAGSGAARSASSGAHARSSHHGHAHAAAASPAETHVVVLNGTETTGLAHRISANLQQSGYTQSAALDARPAGRSSSVVEYAGGHSTEAQHVAQTLGIAQVQPLESAVTPLVGGATVVVIAGADQAALGGEASGASSSGEAADGAAQ